VDPKRTSYWLSAAESNTKRLQSALSMFVVSTVAFFSLAASPARFTGCVVHQSRQVSQTTQVKCKAH
jgi:hypothetical protein